MREGRSAPFQDISHDVPLSDSPRTVAILIGESVADEATAVTASPETTCHVV
jgi:hypothetical protein